jgi:6-phosphogluconolactonase
MRLPAASFAFASLLLSVAAFAADPLVYAGTFNRAGSKGIHAFRFNPSTGKLSALGLAAESTNPSFLAEHPNHRFLYAVNNNPGQPGNTVSAFAIDHKTGMLTALNRVDAKGEGPCHLTLDATGKWVAVANYGSGSIAILPVGADGKLGEAVAFDQQSEEAAQPRQPRAHMALFTPNNKFLIVANVGIDRIYVYRFDAATGKIAPNDPPYAATPKDTGPRHLALHPNGKALYVVNERGSSAMAYSFDPASGALAEINMLSSLPADFKGRNSGAEIAIARSGKFVYTSNRGHDSVAVFAVDPAKRGVTFVEHVLSGGRTPRNFAFDLTEKYFIVGNEGSNTLVVFRHDAKTGKLTPTGESVETPGPACILFVPSK